MSNVFYSITNYILFNARKKLYGQFDLAKINHQLLAFSRHRGKTEPRNCGACYNDIIIFAHNKQQIHHQQQNIIISTIMAVGNRKRTIVATSTKRGRLHLPHIGAHPPGLLVVLRQVPIRRMLSQLRFPAPAPMHRHHQGQQTMSINTN